MRSTLTDTANLCSYYHPDRRCLKNWTPTTEDGVVGTLSQCQESPKEQACSVSEPKREQQNNLRMQTDM